jgi:hypothetical protein
MGRRYGQSITDRETQQAAHQIRHQHRAYPCGSEMRKSLDKSDAPVIGVAPIIAGRALKGPTAKMMREFGMQHRAAAVVRHSATFSTPISSADAESSDNLAQHAVAAKTLDADVAGSWCSTKVLAGADDLTAAGTLRLQEGGDGKT